MRTLGSREEGAGERNTGQFDLLTPAQSPGQIERTGALTIALSQRERGAIEDVIWQLEVCNACRYCEGYCAVFPALERRQRPKPSDVYYLANLCHDCRPCYYACMFTPPHEFAVNLPQAFAEVRRRTYSRYSFPSVLGNLVGHSFGLVTAAAATAAALFAIVALAGGSPAQLFATHAGPGSFYAVIPYVAMFLPALLIVLYGAVALSVGAVTFWRETHGSPGDLFDLAALVGAGIDSLGLRHMRGGQGEGCTYPRELASKWRWLMHLSLLWGFVAAFAATAVAFVYQDAFGVVPPYPVLSAPVALGSLGGLAIIVGATGLIYLKTRSDPAPADEPHVAMDYVFLGAVELVAITGMLLLGLRETAMMGSLLIVHLATVVALFISAPYSKLAHFVYRYVALVQNRVEARDANE